MDTYSHSPEPNWTMILAAITAAAIILIAFIK